MPQKPSYEEMEKRVQELEQIGEKLDQIFSMSLDMICIADIHTATFIKVNPAFTEILGYSEKELLEKSFLDFVHPDDIDATRIVIEQKLKLGVKVINFENRYRCMDGSYRWLSWVSHPSPEQGKTYAIARDITEWKQSQEALKKSKALLDAAGRMARVGGWELDADTMEVTWTEETYRIHEVPFDEKPSLQKAINFFHPEDRPKLEQAIKRALDHGEPYDMEIRFITSKGKHLWTRTICQPETISGKTIKLKGTFQDITDRKKTEEKLIEANLKQQEAIRAGNVGLWDWDLETNKVHYSKEWKHQIGYEDHEISDDFEEWKSRVHPNDLGLTLEKIQKSIVEASDDHNVEFRFRHRDGSYRWIMAQASILQDKTGRPIRMLGAHVDITDRKNAERESLFLRTAIDQAPVGVALADENISIYYCNPEGLGIRGGNAKDLVEIPKDAFKKWQVFMLNGEPYQIEDLPLVRAIEKGETIREEFIVRHQDGTNHICDAFACPVFENGNILGGMIIFLDMTEKKRAEEALRKSEEILSEMARQIPGVLYQFYARQNGERGLYYVSQRSESIFGIKAQLDGFFERFTKMIVPEHREGFIESVEKSVNEISPWHYEGMLQKPTGERIWFSSDSVPLVRENEVVFNGIVQDISERKHYEDEQEITINLLQALHEKNSLHDLIRKVTILMQHWSGCEAVAIRMREGEDYPYFETKGFPSHFVEAERHLCAMDSKGNLIRDSIGNPVLECMCGNVIQGRFNAELPFFTKNGSFWTNSTTDLLASTSEADRQARTRNRCHGEGYESVALIPLCHGNQRFGLLQFNDPERNRFNENKIALFERLASSLAIGLSQRITALALIESEERYRSIMDSMDDAVYICSSDLRIEFCNPAMVRMIGRDATGELCYKAIHGLAEKCPKCIHEQVMEGEYVNTQVTFHDGGRVYHVSNSPIFHTDGSVSKLTIFRDVTEIKKMESRLTQAQKMESIGSLAGGIAHDFNNILFPIIGLSEMLMEDLPAKSPERENAEEILRAGERGSDLVKQILAFSRQSEQKKMPIRIQQILKEVMKLSRSTIPSNIKITQHIQSDCGLVMADPTQLHQIAMNLITNAYHAVEHINGKISIQLREKRLSADDIKGTSLKTGQYAMLSVSDNGCGIDQTNINSIFEPYFTTKEKGKGTGLGLAVVYGIVKDYKGDIKVYSEVGKGTSFNIFIPLLHEPSKDIAINEEAEIIKGGNERILLVDDEKPVVQLERQMLERLGYRVTTRVNSVDAYEAFKANPDMYDLVLTDMTMPNMTGDKLAEKLIFIKPNIPIIICTGFSERISEEVVKSIGIKGLLMKPVVKSEMARMVRRVLDEAKG